MHTDINPLHIYFAIVRASAGAVVREIKGLDLMMFPCNNVVFDDEQTAVNFCEAFNLVSKKSSGFVSLKAYHAELMQLEAVAA